MTLIIISDNRLFVEAIKGTLENRLDMQVLSTTPEEAIECLHSIIARVILVDESIPPGMLKMILKHAQSLAKTRLVLLNGAGNELIILDSFRSTIGDVDDLMKIIIEGESGQETPQSSLRHLGRIEDESES